MRAKQPGATSAGCIATLRPRSSETSENSARAISQNSGRSVLTQSMVQGVPASSRMSSVRPRPTTAA